MNTSSTHTVKHMAAAVAAALSLAAFAVPAALAGGGSGSSPGMIATLGSPDPHDGRACPLVQSSIVTSVPIGVYGQTLAAVASGNSTQPRLCGVPKDARLKAWRASPPWK